jgi:hypothetical protein
MEHRNPTEGGTRQASENHRTLASDGIALDCIAAWKREADDYANKGIAAEAVSTLNRCALELEAAIRSDEERVVSLQDASRICGYSADHLGVLLRQGKLANYARSGAPRLRVCELPRKAGRLTPPRSDAKMRWQIAREIANPKWSGDAQA